MIASPHEIRRAQVAQRAFLTRAALVIPAAFAIGWYLAAAFTAIEQGPAVMPW